jgi:hypothetical protein
MAANGSNLKYGFLEIIKSPWFRAKQADTAGRRELTGIGGGQALTPETLSRRVASVVGSRWTRSAGYTLLGTSNIDLLAGPPRFSIYHELSYGSPDFSLILGGIDSSGIIKRGRLHNGVSASVVERMAIEKSCGTVDADFALPKASRALFPLVDKTDLPGAGDAVIRANLVYLYARFLGEEVAIDHPEIDRLYRLLTDSRAALQSANPGTALSSGCRSGGANTADGNYMMRSWQAVITFLLMDPKFLLE